MKRICTTLILLLILNLAFSQTNYYVNDNNTSNDVFTSSTGNDTNPGTAALPFATFAHALSQANEGDIIYVDAGTYAEQVTIDKGITIIGAGQNLTSIINPGSPLVSPPGPFPEYALIQTAQNIGDVNISNLQTTNVPANDGHSILLQTGGSVKNCRIIDGGLGVFIRIESAVKTIVVENNFIQASVFAVACQGSGLTASVLNNTLNVTNPGFSVGIWVGIDFGPIVKLTATRNSINNYVHRGIVGNSYNTVLTENSILGTGQYAIENNASLAVATCNWYGTSDQYVVTAKMNGNINFSPWLVNGTDNDAAIGFQPVPGSCAGSQLFFVNDNSLTGDIYTTAVGNNANNGSASAPLATITAALAKIQAGDLIIVDAGSYTEIVNVTKNVTILGAGKGVTILNGPAGPVIQLPNTGETGIIQTVAGVTDVIIENLTVDGTVSEEGHGIFIQGGGRVSNCELRYVNDGFYFQFISTQPRTAIGNNNYVHHINYVGFLFAGKGLNGTAINNVIDLNGAIYGIGGIAGYGGDGVVASFTASNNSIINFNGFGIMVGSTQTVQIHNNSVTGLTGNFIQNVHGVNVDATCNWYGTTDAAVIIPNMTGDVTYSPWLTSGTDNDVAFGFQPLSNVCNGRQNKLYVNDNSLTGNVFTSAVGNDANSGIPSAPLLTLNAALIKAQAGDSIFVDAGTYVTPNLNINKSITILGANYNASPNNPVDRLVLNPVRNANSLITGSTFTIAANDVRLEGLAFSPGAKPQVTITTAGANNFTFKRNYSIVTSGNFLNLNGPSIPIGQASTFGNYLVEDNRFESQVTISSLCIVIGALNDVTINNNTFFTPSTSAQRLLTSCAAGNGGLTVNNIYSNNISNAPRNEWFSSGTVASAIIENNISLNGQRSLVIQTSVSISSDIQVRSNYIETNVADLSPIQYLRSGTASPGALANLLIENNTIIQNPTGRTSVPAGILAQNFFNGSNGSTTIRRNKISFNGDYSSFTSSSVLGISFTGNWQNINVEENDIAFNGTNLTNVIPASGQSSSGISISSDNGTNTIPSNAVVNITGNKVSGFKNSFAAYDVSSLAPNTYVGYGNLPAGVNVTINNNSFTGDIISINNGAVGQSVNANCNWYGSAAAQVVANKVSSESVVYSTWLTNGTDNDLATGFQPVPNSCDGTSVVAALNGATNISCFGANNGTITITISGGTGPYTIEWNKNGNTYSSDEDLTNLTPGTYSVAVTDANGSVDSITDIVISQPLLLTASASGSNVSCFGGNNGSASVIADGGTTPYTYLWSNGSTNASVSNLIAGIYTVTVTDANGCTAQANYEVTQPALLAVNLTGTSASCNGSATATVSGGTLPYSYLWSNGATTASINNVPPGLYSVTVTDAHNCIVSGSFTINGNSLINPITSLVHVSCFGGSNARITITGTNTGTAPFTYNLNGSAFQSSPVFNNLVAGVYVVGIKDANGCSDFVSRTINQPSAALTVVLDSLKQPCSGASTGRIFITASGGSAGKTYSWTGPNGFTSTAQDPNNIVAGNYSILVTDVNGCSSNLNVTLPEYPVINVSAGITNVLCFGAATGSIDITVTGGSGSGFTYLWNNGGATTQDRFNLTVGTNYRITVTDIGSGCSVIRRDTVRGPVSAVTVTVPNSNIVNVSGCNSLGSFTAQGSGGTQYSAPDPYRYSINGVDYQTSSAFSNLQAGSHTVTIKDANGCTATKAVTITDNGSDEYESSPNNTGNNNNNARGKAAPFSLGTIVSARIGTATDVDYYKLNPVNTWTGNYTINFVQPLVTVVFDLVGTNGTTVIAPTSSTATSKQYDGLNGTYYIRVSGTNSLSCYQFTVTNGIMTRSSGSNIQPEVTKAQVKDGLFDVKVLGNPTSTSFIMNVITSSDEKISMRVFDAQGRLIEERQGLQPMETLRVGERYINGMYMAEIRQGKNRKTVRLVKM